MKLYLALVCLLSSSNLFANIAWNQPDAKIPSEAKDLIEKTLKNKPTEYTEIDYSVDIKLSNGKVVQKVSRLYYYPDSQSIQNNGYDYIPFNADLDSIQIETLGTIDQNLQFTPVTQQDLKINDSNSYNTFSSQKNAIFNFPKLEKETFGIISYTITRDSKKQEADWSKELFPQNVFPRKNYNISISWDDQPIYWNNKSSYLKCDQKKNSIICSGKDIPAIKTDDSVYWMDEFDSLQLGTLKTWDEATSLAEKKFFTAVDSYENEIGVFVEKLVGSEKDLEKKIDIVHRFVAQEIQYTSHSEHGNAITPHPVTRTLKKRFGDCKDKAALFYSMLNELNVWAAPVLVATNRNDSAKLSIPSLNYFDHMIVCFSINNKIACADLTNSNADWRYISPHIQGKISLTIRPNSKPNVLHAESTRWKMRIDTVLDFDSRGGQIESSNRQYYSEYSSIMRADFAGLTNDEITKKLVKTYNDQIAKDVSPAFLIKGLDKLNSPITISSKTEYSPFLNTKTDLEYTERDAWVLSELDSMVITNKEYGVWISGMETQSDNTFDISSHWNSISLPADLYLNHLHGFMERKIVVLGNGKFKVSTQVRIPKQFIKADSIKKFNDMISLFKRESSMHIYGKLKPT